MKSKQKNFSSLSQNILQRKQQTHSHAISSPFLIKSKGTRHKYQQMNYCSSKKAGLYNFSQSSFSEVFILEYLSLAVTDIWGWVILSCGDCSVHYIMFCSIPGLHPLHECLQRSLNPAVMTARVSPDIAKGLLRITSPLVEFTPCQNLCIQPVT